VRERLGKGGDTPDEIRISEKLLNSRGREGKGPIAISQKLLKEKEGNPQRGPTV